MPLLLYFGVVVDYDYTIRTEQKNQTLRREVGRNSEKVMKNINRAKRACS